MTHLLAICFPACILFCMLVVVILFSVYSNVKTLQESTIAFYSACLRKFWDNTDYLGLLSFPIVYCHYVDRILTSYKLHCSKCFAFFSGSIITDLPLCDNRYSWSLSLPFIGITKPVFDIATLQRTCRTFYGFNYVAYIQFLSMP